MFVVSPLIGRFAQILEKYSFSDFTIIKPHGGWSMFLDVSRLGLTSGEASKRLLDKAQIAATPMINWGTQRSDNYVRLVFSNEPIGRLKGIGKKVTFALTN